MKKLKLFLTLLIIAVFAMGAKISDNTLRIGEKTGADVEIQIGGGVLKWDNALSKVRLSDDGIGFTSFSDIVSNEAAVLENITADTSVAANALTIDSKIADGTTDPSAGSPHRVAFRDSVADDGAYNFVSQTSSLTLVVPSGATLGHVDTTNGFIYVYILDNAGAMELAVSSKVQNESEVQTTVAIDGTSDDDGFYSTVARANVPIRLFARLISNQTTAGTWALDVTGNVPSSKVSSDSKVESTISNRRVEVMSVNQTGTQAFTQEGSWVDSIVDNGAGSTTVNITSGICSQPVTCYTQPFSSSGGFIHVCRVYNQLSTAFDFDCENTNSGTDVDTITDILCTCKR